MEEVVAHKTVALETRVKVLEAAGTACPFVLSNIAGNIKNNRFIDGPFRDTIVLLCGGAMAEWDAAMKGGTK